MEMEMDSTVDSMAAAYDELLDAVAAIIAEPVRTPAAIRDLTRRLHAFLTTCDRAEDLVNEATNRLGLLAGGARPTCTGAAVHPPSPGTGTSRLDSLLQALQAIAQHDRHHPADLQVKDKAAAGEKQDSNNN